MAFVRQFTQDPTQEQLLEIEAINVVDIAPPAPGTGVGTGAMLVVGEYEDGPFAAGGDSAAYDPNRRGPLEARGSVDLEQKFGGFGFTRAGVPHNDPCARQASGELWNGSAFIKLRNMRMSRLFCARVDTSVGEVLLTPQVTLRATNRGPFSIAPGAWLSVDVNAAGAAAATSIAATAAVLTANAAPAAILAGDAIEITVDGGAPVTVSFDGVSSAIADVVLRINTVLGATIASDSGGFLRLTGQILGTLGAVSVTEVVAGSGTRLGYTAPTLPLSAAGTGNVGDSTAITSAELAPLVAAIASLSARVDTDGFLVLSATTSIQVSASTAQALLGFPTTLVDIGDNAAASIPAGLRVTDSTTTWVTMQTVDVPAGSAVAVSVKVRPATDDGTAVGAGAGTVTTATDQPSGFDVTVTNPLALTVALTEPQKDTLYQAAWDATLGADVEQNPSRDADYSICARRTDSTIRQGRQNALDATEQGLRNRKFIGRAALGLSPDQALTDVALYRSDRHFYTYPGVRVRIPEIATRGTAGGTGFTADGIITVGADNPLGTLCCRLNPEQNPAESGTGQIEYVLGLEDVGRQLNINDYKAFKAAGIAAPFRDPTTSWEFLSGVTTSLTSGRTTMARRRMADFLQDSYKATLKPYQKKLNVARERNASADAIQSFMESLLPENQEELQRIAAFLVDRDSGNTDERIALGIYVILTTVRTLSSLDAIVVRTEIGENAIINTEL
jgi:hypothetical protein